MVFAVKDILSTWIIFIAFLWKVHIMIGVHVEMQPIPHHVLMFWYSCWSINKNYNPQKKQHFIQLYSTIYPDKWNNESENRILKWNWRG